MRYKILRNGWHEKSAVYAPVVYEAAGVPLDRLLLRYLIRRDSRLEVFAF